MNSDKLYELAFEYKKTRLWQKLSDRHLFAVKLSNGDTGYVCIMGKGGEHNALALYIGNSGFDSWRALYKAGDLDSFELEECFFRQNCMQCEFTDKDSLSESEYREAKEYARKHNIRIGGKNAYPQFVKYAPECYPWFLQSDEDRLLLCEALTAAIEVAELLNDKYGMPELLPVNDRTETIPLLGYKNGGYMIGETRLPKDIPRVYPEPVLNDLYAARLKKAKRYGVWECGIVRLPEPIQNEPDEVPAYPMTLVAVDSESKFLLKSSLVIQYEKNAKDLLNTFAESFLDNKICPQQIKVCDRRTMAFMKSFCERLNIPLIRERRLHDFEDAAVNLLDYMGNKYDEIPDERLLEMVKDILNMDDEYLADMPSEIFDRLKELTESETLPADLAFELRAKLGLKTKNTQKIRSALSDKSYVISVSLQTGCYRHIRISADSTLEELSIAILDAFEFDNDHAHAFFMDNSLWSRRNGYFMRGMGNGSECATDECTLEQSGISPGQKFLYLFDFGDEWVFRCKMLRTEDTPSAEPTVIRRKGVPPSQYPEWDEY